MTALKAVRGKRTRVKTPSNAGEEVRIVFVPVEGQILCIEIDTLMPVQIDLPVITTIPRGLLSTVHPGQE